MPQFEPMHLRDYWQIGRRRVGLILSVALIGTALVAYWTATWPDYYQSTARIEINPEPRNQAAGNLGPSAVDDAAYFNTQLQLLTGRTLLRSVITTLHLDTDEYFNRHLGQGGRLLGKLLRLFPLKEGYKDWEPTEAPLTPDLRPAVTARDLEEARRLGRHINALRNGLTVEQVKETRGITKQTRLVSITYRHPHPALSAKVVNAVADAMALGASRKQQWAGDETSQYLRTRIEDLKKEISGDQARLVDYGTDHDIVSLESGQNVAVDRLLDLNKELTESESARKAIEAEYLAQLAAAEEGEAVVQESDTLQGAKSQLAELKRKKELLLVGATEKWPRVQEATRQIEVLEEQVGQLADQEAAQRHAQMNTRLRQARLREQAAREAFHAQERAAHSQNRAAVQYRLVEQEIEANQALLSSLIVRLREHDLAQAGGDRNIKVVDYAVMPDPAKPDGPLRLLFLVGAFCIFFTGGYGLAFFREYMNDTFRTEDEVRELLQVRTLATIPAAHDIEKGALMRSMGLLEYHMTGPSSALEDDYRRLRTTILLATENKASRTLLVTSTVPGEGKTTTAINLACSFQSNGSNVLLIDGDLRRPRLHLAFGGSNDIGLRNILTATEQSGGDWYGGFVNRDERTGVSYVPSGRAAENSTELIGSRRMSDFLAWASTEFDLVIADSPSLTSSADPVLLAHQVESVILVVGAGSSSREMVEDSKRLLANAGADLLGVVLNNADKRHSSYSDAYFDRNGGSAGRKRTSIVIRRHASADRVTTSSTPPGGGSRSESDASDS